MSTQDKKPDAPDEIEKTGHVWDGIEEYNNPLPLWWLWIFYATIAWALVYTILFPAWPMLTQATPGLLGYSSRANVAAEIAEWNERNAPIRERLVAADLAVVAAAPAGADRELLELSAFARNAGEAIYETSCASCHGPGGAGVLAAGYPNLLDDDWLWGGDVENIYLTIAHGIRNTTHPETRYSVMPAFGDMLTEEEITQLVHHTLAISGQAHDAALAAPGAELYLANCAACHGDAGEGIRELGAPPLNDAIWLYGGSEDAIRYSIVYSRYGVMPGFSDRLSEADLRAVTLFVHGLGGGE
jgi:cytochrome c oxidase cbb3-type subunit 3